MSRKFIALTLKKLREESGLTADEVGARIGKSGKTVNAWENDRGQPDVDTLFKLCELYGVDDIASVFSDNFQESSALQSLTDEEALLIRYYREFNASGKEKLLDYADDIAASGKYKADGKKKTYVLPYAARGGDGVGTIELTEEQLEKLKKAPGITDL